MGGWVESSLMRMGSQLGSWSTLVFLILLLSIQGNESARGLQSNLYPHVPPVKTFQTAYGDQIDCVNIYSQPAFGSPLLGEHELQRMSLPSLPVDLPKEGPNSESKSAINSESWSVKETCPEGTVAILRTPNLPPDLVSKQGINSGNGTSSRQEYATMKIPTGVYLGGVVDLNIWNPRVEGAKEYSSARILFANGPNVIEIGWHVYPAIYKGDNQTRFYVSWTTDGYQNTGCYNLLCPGFVQVSKNITPGAVLPGSENGGKQWYIRIIVLRDESTKNWWLVMGDREVVGYWPSALVKDLALGATSVEWGGEICNDGNASHTATQMGSGHFPSEGGDRVSAFCGNLYYFNEKGNLTMPGSVTPTVTRPECYGIKDAGDLGEDRGHTFYYGGPGRNDKCT